MTAQSESLSSAASFDSHPWSWLVWRRWALGLFLLFSGIFIVAWKQEDDLGFLLILPLGLIGAPIHAFICYGSYVLMRRFWTELTWLWSDWKTERQHRRKQTHGAAIIVQPFGRLDIQQHMDMDTHHIKQTISGGTFTNSPVAVNQINQSPTDPSALGPKIRDLVAAFECMYPHLSDPKAKDEAQRKLQRLKDEASRSEPDKDQMEVSAKGLIEAARTCGEMAGPVIRATKALLQFLGVPLP